MILQRRAHPLKKRPASLKKAGQRRWWDSSLPVMLHSANSKFELTGKGCQAVLFNDHAQNSICNYIHGFNVENGQRVVTFTDHIDWLRDEQLVLIRHFS